MIQQIVVVLYLLYPAVASGHDCHADDGALQNQEAAECRFEMSLMQMPKVEVAQREIQLSYGRPKVSSLQIRGQQSLKVGTGVVTIVIGSVVIVCLLTCIFTRILEPYIVSRPALSKEEDQKAGGRPGSKNQTFDQVSARGSAEAREQNSLCCCTAGMQLLLRRPVRFRGEALPSTEKGPEGEVVEVPSTGAMPEAGVQAVPPWGRLAIVWLVCCLSAGILPGQAVFVKLFVQAGIYGGACTDGNMGCEAQFLEVSALFTFGTFLSLAIMAPVGIVFDRWGSQVSGTVGTAMCATGLLILWFSIVCARSEMFSAAGWCFVPGVLLTDIGSFLNSFSSFGLVWHFPGKQALFTALIMSTYQFSAFFPLFIEACMAHLGVSFAGCMLTWCCLAFFMTYLCWVYMPSQKEYYAKAEEVLGMPLPKPPKELQIWTMLKKAFEVMYVDMRDHLACAASVSFAWILPGLYAVLCAAYSAELFPGTDAGDKLASTFVLWTGIIGTIVVPLTSHIIDTLGLHSLIYTLAFLQALTLMTVGVKSWACQEVTQVALILWLSLFNVMMNRYMLCYAPPNRFGTVTGFFTSLTVICLAVPLEIGAFGALAILPPGLESFRKVFVFSGLLGTVASFAYSIYFRRNPPPEDPRLLQDDEEEIARGFGCRTLDELAYITNTPSKHELLKLLTKTDADSIASVAKSVDTAKMMEMMSQRTAEDIADMMEKADREPEEEDEPLEGDTAVLEVEVSEHDPISPKVRKFNDCLNTRDAHALKRFMLEESIDDIDGVSVWIEENLSKSEHEKMDDEFNKLLPGIEFAQLLRQRVELKQVVQRRMKRELDRTIAKFTGPRN